MSAPAATPAASSAAAEKTVAIATQYCAFCGKEALKRCAACHAVSYCTQEHQKADWKKHKPDCLALRPLPDEDTQYDLNDPAEALRAHSRAFRQIIRKYRLDKDGKADRLADLLCSPEANNDPERAKDEPESPEEQKAIRSAEQLAASYGLSPAEVSTFLSFIHIGVRYKVEHLDPSKEQYMDQLSKAS